MPKDVLSNYLSGGYQKSYSGKKKKSSKKYVIVKGRAYPIGSAPARKKKRSREPRQNDYGMFGFGQSGKGQQGGSIAKEYYGAGKNIYQTAKAVKDSPAVGFIRKKISGHIQKSRAEKRERQAAETRKFMGVPKEDDALRLKRYMGYS